MDISTPGSSVRGILQAKILKCVAIPFSRGSSWHRDWIQVSCIAGRFLTIWATREAQKGCKSPPSPPNQRFLLCRSQMQWTEQRCPERGSKGWCEMLPNCACGRCLWSTQSQLLPYQLGQEAGEVEQIRYRALGRETNGDRLHDGALSPFASETQQGPSDSIFLSPVLEGSRAPSFDCCLSKPARYTWY